MATVPNPLASHLAALAGRPFIPELHADDCDDVSCVACRLLLSTTLYSIDTWLDNRNVFAKQFTENVEGELVVTGLRIGHRPDHVVAKFGDVIVRHYDGRHTVRAGVVKPDELTAADWNSRYEVGTPVVAYPGCRPEGVSDVERLVTRTRSKAQTLGGHTPVVWVDGHGACIALTHIDVTTGGA